MVVDTPDTGNGGSSGSGFSMSLTRKIGPLPVWGWCALAIVAVLAYKHFRPAAPKTDSTTTGANTTDGTAAAVTTDTGLATSTPADNSSTGSYTNDSGNSWLTPTTNAEWKTLALAKVSSLNSWGAYQIANALSAYLGGAVLDSTQKPIIDTALKMVGPPPEPVPNAPAVPPPAAPPKPPPPPTGQQPVVLQAALQNPVPNKIGQKVHINVSAFTKTNRAPVAATWLVQTYQASNHQWIDYDRVVTNSSGVGTYTHPIGASHVTYQYRIANSRSDNKHSGLSNAVSVVIK
jgi:hypothetical protein